MPQVIGIDIGGSSAKLGLVDTASASIIARETVTTGFEVHATEFLGALRTAISRLAAHGNPQALGVGMPGLQDSEGRVKDASNLPGLNGIAMASELARERGWPSRMDNDLNVLALGEAHYGGHGMSRLL